MSLLHFEKVATIKKLKEQLERKFCAWDSLELEKKPQVWGQMSQGQLKAGLLDIIYQMFTGEVALPSFTHAKDITRDLENNVRLIMLDLDYGHKSKHETWQKFHFPWQLFGLTQVALF